MLFDKEKFTYLKQKAKEEKTSVGKLIREAVATVYLEKETETRRGALKRALQMEPVDFGPVGGDLLGGIQGGNSRRTI